MTTEETTPPFEASASSEIAEGKTIAFIAYLTFIGLLIAFIMNNDKKNGFASFHIRQSLGIMLAALALMFVNVIPILGWIVSFFGSLFLFILAILGFLSALKGERKTVPVLGARIQEWLKDIG